MYENKWFECYVKLRNIIQDSDIWECSFLINVIKEYRWNKNRAAK